MNNINGRLIVSAKNAAILDAILAKLKTAYGEGLQVTSAHLPNSREPFEGGFHVFVSLAVPEGGVE